MRMTILIRAIAFAAAVAATACINGDDGNQHVIPSGGNFPVSSASTGATITGRVCVITSDATALAACATTGAGGLTVRFGTAIATTADNGTFVLSAAASPNIAFNVTGPAIVPSTRAFTVPTTIPVLTQQLFDQVLAQNGIVLSGGTGSIFASVINSAGQPVSGVTVNATPSPLFGPFFDGTTPAGFTLNGTGARGVVFLPGMSTASPATITFTDSGATNETTVAGIQVIDGGITFTDAVLP